MRSVKRAIIIAGGGLLLAGCSSFYMKASPFYDGPDSAYTEPIEQRVNLWPLVYSRDPALSVIWPLYTQNTDCWYAWPLLTWKDHRDFGSIPLLTWSDGDDFVSLPVLTWKNGREWTSLPLLTQYKDVQQTSKSGSVNRVETYDFLFGVGSVKYVDERYDSSHVFPFYADNAKSFHSLLYCHEADDSWSIPLIGTLKTREYGYDQYAILLLAGYSTTPNGYRGSYLFPLYVDEPNAFYSLPFGYTESCWWATPLWIHTQQADLGLLGLCGFGEKTWWATPAAIGTEKGFYGLLGLQGWRNDGPNWLLPLYWANPKENAYATLLAGRVGGYDWWCTPLVSTYRDGDADYFWAWPLCGRNVRPGREHVWWLGGLPLWTREETETGTSESFLWRLWHKETRGADVTVDCFPGITYDTRPNGYEKTSFLWRVYRNEFIPGKGRNLDVLFIPFSSAD